MTTKTKKTTTKKLTPAEAHQALKDAKAVAEIGAKYKLNLGHNRILSDALERV